MNRDKQFIYDFRKNAPKPETIDSWLKRHKHGTWLKTYRECLEVETRPRHRHRRSVAIRGIRHIYGFTVLDLLLTMEFTKRFNYPHGVGFKQYSGRRLYVYYY